MPEHDGVKVTYCHVRRAHAYHKKRIYELSELSGVDLDTLKGYYRRKRNGPLPETEPARKIAKALKLIGIVFQENDQISILDINDVI